ncbi:lipocalin family protein [uncultured Tenacibaculum sp.]|uniref:lipocalin family protein n=1 Tax=uncultured Tenacibaculum sp. TaxID=174713 RepID=UPI00262AD75B|nr:lipocalin family protein [uncultured Tenacibaculum sp.]
MIKKTLLIIILIGLNSCVNISELDEISTSDRDKITKVWELQKQFINGIEQQTSDCVLDNLFDIADNNILIFYDHQLNNSNCISSTISGRWNMNGNSLTIDWDEPISGRNSYQIEILKLTNTTLQWRREISNGVFLEEIYN